MLMVRSGPLSSPPSSAAAAAAAAASLLLQAGRQAVSQCAGPGTSPSPAGSPVLSSVSFTDLVVWGLRHLKTTDYTFKNHKLLNL